MKTKLFFAIACFSLIILFSFHLSAQIKEACLDWDRGFPRVESKLSLDISGLELILNPPSSATMRSNRAGELVSPTKGSFKSDGKKEIQIEFVFESNDPDECHFNCKEQSKAIRSFKNPEEVYESCFTACRQNTSYKYGKDKVTVPLKFKIYRDESETLRVDSLSYRDPNPILGKLTYTFPHYFAGDLVGCSGNVWD